MSRLPNYGQGSVATTHALAQHCEVCAAAAKLIYRDPTPYEAGALRTMMLMHRQNDQEREDFYRRYLRYLYGDQKLLRQADE